MDEDAVIHRHGDEEVRLRVEREQTIDGLLVRHFECECGEERVLLAPRKGDKIGPSWPIPWLATD